MCDGSRVPERDGDLRSAKAELQVLRDSISCTHAVSVTFPILVRLDDANGDRGRAPVRQVAFCAFAFGERIELWSSDPEFGGRRGGGGGRGSSLLHYTGATWRAADDTERRIETLEVGRRADGDRVLLVTLAARSSVAELLVVAWRPDQFTLATFDRIPLSEAAVASPDRVGDGVEKKKFTLPQRRSSSASSSSSSFGGSQRLALGRAKTRVSGSWVAHQSHDAHLFYCDLDGREPDDAARFAEDDDDDGGGGEWIRLVRSLVVPPKVAVPPLSLSSSSSSSSPSSSSVASPADGCAPDASPSDGASSSLSRIPSTTLCGGAAGPIAVWHWPPPDERARGGGGGSNDGGGDIVDFAWLDTSDEATAPSASARPRRLLAVLRRHVAVHPERTLLHPFACSLAVVEVDVRRRTTIECHSIRNLASDFFRIVPVPHAIAAAASSSSSSSRTYTHRPSGLVMLIAPNAVAVLRDDGRVLDSLHLLNDRVRFADGLTPSATPSCLAAESCGESGGDDDGSVYRSRSACSDRAVPTEFAAKRGEPIVLSADTVFLVHAPTRSLVAVGCSIGGGGGPRSHGAGQVATLTLDDLRSATSSVSRVRLRARRLPLGPTRVYASCATWLVTAAAAATATDAAAAPNSTATAAAVLFVGSRIGDSFAYRVRAELTSESQPVTGSVVSVAPGGNFSPTPAFGVTPAATWRNASLDDTYRVLLERARQRQELAAARFRSWSYDVRSLELRAPLQTWRTNGVVSGLCRSTGDADLAVLHGYAEYGQLSLLPSVGGTESSDGLRTPEPVVHVDLSAILAPETFSSSSSSPSSSTMSRGDAQKVASLWALSLMPSDAAPQKRVGEPRWLIVLQLGDGTVVALLFFGAPATGSGSGSTTITGDAAAAAAAETAQGKRRNDSDSEAPEFRRIRKSSLGPSPVDRGGAGGGGGAAILGLAAFGARLLCVTCDGVVAEHRLVRAASADYVIVGVRSVDAAAVGPPKSFLSASSGAPTRLEQKGEIESKGDSSSSTRLVYCRVIAPTVVFVVRRDASCAFVYRTPTPATSSAAPRDALSWRVRNLAYPRGDGVRSTTTTTTTTEVVALSDHAPHLLYAVDGVPRGEQKSGTTSPPPPPPTVVSSPSLLRVYMVPTAQSRELRRHAAYRLSDLGAARIVSVRESRTATSVPTTPAPPTGPQCLDRTVTSLQVVGELLTVELDDGRFLVYDTLGHGRVLELRYSQHCASTFSAVDRDAWPVAAPHRNVVAHSHTEFQALVGGGGGGGDNTAQIFAFDRRRAVRVAATYRLGRDRAETVTRTSSGAHDLTARRPDPRVASSLLHDAAWGGALAVSVGDADHILRVVRLATASPSATAASSHGSHSSAAAARSTGSSGGDDELAVGTFGRTRECRLGATPRFIVHLPVADCFAVIVSLARAPTSDAAQDDHDGATSPVLPSVLQYELLYCSARDASVIGRYGEFRVGERVTSLSLASSDENGGGGGGGGSSAVERLLVTTAVTESADFASTGRLMVLLPSVVIAIVPLAPAPETASDPRRPSALRTTTRRLVKTRPVAELLDRPFTAATTLDARHVVAAGDHRLRVYAVDRDEREEARTVGTGRGRGGGGGGGGGDGPGNGGGTVVVDSSNASRTTTTTAAAPPTARMRLRLVTWCDGPYYCRNLWRVGARYVYWEDRARNVFMGVWDAELLTLVVVAPPAPETRRFRASTGPTLLLRHGGTVEFLAYAVDDSDADENDDGSQAGACTRVWRTRLEARPHTKSSLALAHLAVAVYPLARLGRRMTMATERVRRVPRGVSRSDPRAPATLPLASSSSSSSSSSSFSSSRRNPSEPVPPRFADAVPSDSSALAFAARRPTCGVSDDATVWIANDLGVLVASTRRS